METWRVRSYALAQSGEALVGARLVTDSNLKRQSAIDSNASHQYKLKPVVSHK